jgi:RNA polymerase sigma-70 factor (ECF subfamily)
MRPIGPFDQTEHAEIVTALGKLPADQREALVLVEAAGFSFTEAGHICRCPRVRFRNLVTSAQQTLGSLLSKRRSAKRAAIRLCCCPPSIARHA